MRAGFVVTVATIILMPLIAMAQSATKAEAAHAISSAATRIKQAGALDDQWIATLAAFKEAKQAQRNGDFAMAQDKAMQAEKLATLSIAQATAEKKLWVDEVVH